MTTTQRRTLVVLSVLTALLGLVGVPVRASAPSLQFQTQASYGSALYRVSFSGFGNDETLALSFTAPGGSTAQVGDDSVFWASSQEDGSGVFNFRPADWLSPLAAGRWTVTATGQTSGLSVSTTFQLGDD
jgi:hypothetical protein